METLAANLAGQVRRETWFGRDFLVAPLSLIVPGVLNGSKGPLYYPEDEVAAHPGLWNGVPLVVNHPYDDAGRPVSARDPKVLERSGIGYVFQDRFDGGARRAEGWLDAERTRAVEPRVYEALAAGRPVELSTGLFTTDVAGEGTFNGASYKATARDYRPDHLAILPDAVGACSVADGCGLNVNAAAATAAEPTKCPKCGYGMSAEEAERGECPKCGAELPEGRATNAAGGYHPGFLRWLYDNAEPVANGLAANPYPNEHACRVADPGKFLKDSFRRKSVAPGVSLILGKTSAGGSMTAQAYRLAKDKFTAAQARAWLKDHDVDCSAFEPASGTTTNAGAAMDRKATIDWLTTNCECLKAQAGELEKLSDEALAAVKAVQEKAATPPAVTATTTNDAATVVVTANAAPRLTPEEQEDLAFARAERQRQKAALVARLTANVADPAAKAAAEAVYNEMPAAKLKALVSALPPAPAPQQQPAWADWSGAAGGPPAVNAKDDSNNLLPPMKFDFGAAATA